MAFVVPAPFQISYADFEHYPKSRIHLPFPDGTIEEFQKQLTDAEARDYQLLQRPEDAPIPLLLGGAQPPAPSKTEVIFWETSATSPNLELFIAKSDAAIQNRLGDNVVTIGNQTTGSIATVDPLCRFIFLRGESSLSPLLLTRKSLQRIFTYHQVMPSLLSFLGVFGRRESAIDCVSSGFREESCINNPPADLNLPLLGRSGRHFQLCYTLKTATLKSPTSHKWSLRPLVVHHQYDINASRGTALWIIAQGNLDIYKKIKRLTGPTGADVNRNFATCAASFRASLVVHVTNAHWARAGWHQYLDELAQRVKEKTAPALDNERKQADTRQEYTSDEVREVQLTEEDLNDAATCLEGNIQVLRSLHEFYHRLSQNRNFPMRKECGEDIGSFLHELEIIEKDMEVELQRVRYHTKVISERKALIAQYLSVQQNEINTSLASDTRRIALASQRETVAVSIITILTLFYLPATFVSVSTWVSSLAESTALSTGEKTFLSSNVVDWGNGNKTASILQWIEITAPLTAGTVIFALVIFYVRYDRKKNSILPRWVVEKD